MDSNKLLTIFYVWANFIAIIIMLILLLKNLKNKQTISRCLSMVMIHLIIYFIGDSIWAFAYFKVFGENEVLLRISRMIYYSASDIIAFSWLMYVELVLNPNIDFKKRRKILLIPVCISIVATIFICSFLNPAAKNIYGYLTALSLIIVSFVYIIGSGIHVIIYLKKNHDERNKKRLIKFTIWPIVIIVFSVMQVFIPEIPIYCFGAIIVTVYLYVENQDSFIFTDALTGAYNREMLNTILNELNKESNYYILMLDIDEFKKINDTYGHIEGDRALKHFSLLLKNTLKPYNASIVRYGGDEFLIIIKIDDEAIINDIINNIHDNLKLSKNDLGFNYSSSIGYSKINNDLSNEENIALADEMLYKNKEIAHRNK